MQKEIFYDKNALKELRKFNKNLVLISPINLTNIYEL